MHHDCPTQPCFHTLTMRVKACTHGCLWDTSVISLSVHTLGLGQKKKKGTKTNTVSTCYQGFLIKEPTDRHKWWNKHKTDGWIELYVPVNTGTLRRLYSCWGEWLFVMSVFWYFGELGGTPAEVLGGFWQTSQILKSNWCLCPLGTCGFYCHSWKHPDAR